MALLRGFGSYLPERVVGNVELGEACAVEPEWIFQSSGIEERRYAGDEETVASLGVKAAEDCLRRCGLAAGDVGMLVVASGSAERFCPGPAATIATELGMGSTLAVDVPVASAGSLLGMAMAERFAPSLGRVLVVASEIMSRRVRRTPEGKNTAILFGDGAGAVLVDPEQGFARIAGDALFSDGCGAEILRMTDGLLYMEGGSVILQAARKIPSAVKGLLERHGVAPEQVGQVVMHQANLNLIQKVARSIGVPMERFFVNIGRYGNTSSASMLIAADAWWTGEALTEPVIFAAFGAGLNWGAMLVLPVLPDGPPARGAGVHTPF